jgi:NADPH-dependent curcumin reductase CurA
MPPQLGFTMTQTATINRKIVLASRPFGAPTADNFNTVSTEKPNIPVTNQGALFSR